MFWKIILGIIVFVVVRTVWRTTGTYELWAEPFGGDLPVKRGSYNECREWARMLSRSEPGRRMKIVRV